MRVRSILIWLAVSLSVLVVCEGFQVALFADAPSNVLTHGVPAGSRQVKMAAVYGGFAREAAEGGGLLMHNHHTAMPHEATLVRPKEWLVGRTVALLGLDPAKAFRVERAFAVLVFVGGVMLLARTFLEQRRTRASFVAAALLGGTLYWLPPLLPGLAGEPGLWRSWLGPETRESGLGYGYGAQLLGVPHLAAELGWFALAVSLAVLAARERRPIWALAAGLAILALCSVRPYTVPIALAASGAAQLPDLLARGRRAGALVRIAAVSLPVMPMVAHLYGVLRGDSVFATLDVIHPAPPTFELALFVGLPAFLLPLLALGLWRASARPGWSAGTAAALGWTLTQLALIHGAPWVQWEVEPINPLLILCLLGAWRGLERLAAPTALLVGLAGLHAFGTLAWGLELWRARLDPFGPLYLPRAEMEALRALEGQRPEGSMWSDRPPAVLVANEQMALFGPWLGGVRVFVGHPDHSPDISRLRPLVHRALDSGGGLAGLAGEGASHLFLGPRERDPAPPWVARTGVLVPIAESSGGTLYRIDPERLPRSRGPR